MSAQPADDYVPEWKRQMLAERVERAARAARPRPCPDCGAPTLVGVGDDWTTRSMTVDADPLPDARRTLEVIVSALTGRGVYARMYAGELNVLDRSQLGIWPGLPVPVREPLGPAMPLHLSHECPGDPSAPTERAPK